jgi:hypothetical protein
MKTATLLVTRRIRFRGIHSEGGARLTSRQSSQPCSTSTRSDRPLCRDGVILDFAILRGLASDRDAQVDDGAFGAVSEE